MGRRLPLQDSARPAVPQWAISGGRGVYITGRPTLCGQLPGPMHLTTAESEGELSQRGIRHWPLGPHERPGCVRLVPCTPTPPSERWRRRRQWRTDRWTGLRCWSPRLSEHVKRAGGRVCTNVLGWCVLQCPVSEQGRTGFGPAVQWPLWSAALPGRGRYGVCSDQDWCAEQRECRSQGGWHAVQTPVPAASRARRGCLAGAQLCWVFWHWPDW